MISYIKIVHNITIGQKRNPKVEPDNRDYDTTRGDSATRVRVPEAYIGKDKIPDVNTNTA